MPSFDEILEQTLKWEGGFVDDPLDPGGRTKYGISEAAHPEEWVNGPPTLKRAREVYRSGYWEQGGAWLKVEGFDRTAGVLFDFMVMSGGAAREFQKMVHADPDGIIGAHTMDALVVEADRMMALDLLAVREKYYRGLGKANPKLTKFVPGWLNRLKDWRAWVNKR